MFLANFKVFRRAKEICWHNPYFTWLLHVTIDSFSALLQIKIKNHLYTADFLFQCVSNDHKLNGFWYTWLSLFSVFCPLHTLLFWVDSSHRFSRNIGWADTVLSLHHSLQSTQFIFPSTLRFSWQWYMRQNKPPLNKLTNKKTASFKKEKNTLVERLGTVGPLTTTRLRFLVRI